MATQKKTEKKELTIEQQAWRAGYHCGKKGEKENFESLNRVDFPMDKAQEMLDKWHEGYAKGAREAELVRINKERSQSKDLSKG